MIRVKQVGMLLLLGGVLCTVFLTVGRYHPEPAGSFTAVLLKHESLIAHSQHLINHGKETTRENSEVNIQDESDVAAMAKKVSSYNRTVLVTMVNDAYLPFTFSWLCNTKTMGIHKSVLFITTDNGSKEKLTRDWPDVTVVSMGMDENNGDQVYSQVGYVKIMVKRTEMLLSILMADVEIFLFEVDCLWLGNPVPGLQKMTGYDVLVNPVSNTGNKVFAGGFIWLFPTDKSKALWGKLTEDMMALGERIKNKTNNAAVSAAENDQQFFSRLINKRYANVSVKTLPLDIYADGRWYDMPETKRKASHPTIINNNWVIGNKAKIDRAKKWKHWFIQEDFSCDMELIKHVVYS